MKIISIKKVGPETYRVVFKKWWSNREFQRYVIISECGVPFYRDSDEIANDCLEQVGWMIRNNVEYFNNNPNHNGPILITHKS
jgi:hypothetical protein